MFSVIELPVWFVVIAAILAAIAALERMLIPSVRWYLRRRMERVVAKVNTRLDRPIEPFKLARRYDTILRVIYHPDVMQAVTDHAQEEGIPRDVAFEQARRYAREIVPSFSATTYFGIGVRAARILSHLLYRVHISHYDKAVNSIPPDKTVIFVMNHRSNMDYVLITHLAAGQSTLSYAVGEWAKIWPLSAMIRLMGAYFIRRKSRNMLYRRVLARYVQLAAEEGVTQAIFPEGGLSLNGHLQEPKMGLLSYIINGWSPAQRDIVFVPIALNYDRVIEDRILLRAHETGKRKFNMRLGRLLHFAGRQLWFRLTDRTYRLGYAAASFGAPLSLSEFGANNSAPPDPEALAKALMTRIGAVMPMLPVPLVAKVLADAKGPLSEEYITTQVETLHQDHINLPSECCKEAVKVGLGIHMRRKLITKGDKGYQLPKENRTLIEYYAASLTNSLNDG